METVRTPDDRFADLPDFAYRPGYVEVDAGDGSGDRLRLAYVADGPVDGPVVLLLHGEPTWSFLYRRMLPVLAGHGLRAIALDLVGFGRSDKPVRREEYSYARHVEWVRSAVFDELDLREVTFVGQDWGGLIGLRLVAENIDRFARVVVANTGLPTGDQPMPEVWWQFRRMVETVEEFDVGRTVAMGCTRGLADDVRSGYDAPFPEERYKAGARAFPLLVPTAPDDPATAANRAAWGVLTRSSLPFLVAFSDQDPITGSMAPFFAREVPGARDREHPTITGAGHFLQEDAGPELAEQVASFVRETPTP